MRMLNSAISVRQVLEVSVVAIEQQAPIDEAKLGAFMNRALEDLGGAYGTAMVFIGDRLGLYRAMDGAGPLSTSELAERTGTAERYVREWLNGQAAAGYITYEGAGRYSLAPEQAMALSNEDSPVFLPGLFQGALAACRSTPKLLEVFRSGAGLGWHEHDPELFEGVERGFRPGYKANLVSAWIPALDGVDTKLKRGARVADVGCGFGTSTILMAETYPNSTFVGFDFHEPSIREASQRAAAAGVVERVRFELATAKTYPGAGYDLVTMFDCLHDMGDPVGAGRHIFQTLDEDGTWLIVEPFAGDRLEDNLTPLGRMAYGASTLLCTPASLAQEVGTALGAQAGELRLRDVVTAAGFTRFRRAAESPFNLVLEARR
jgi:SAM-dependent methyltransferase